MVDVQTGDLRAAVKGIGEALARAAVPDTGHLVATAMLADREVVAGDMATETFGGCLRNTLPEF